jgi:hypothetical protein
MMLPVRYGPVLADVRNLSEPEPLYAPLGVTTVIHGVVVDADHEHPDWVLTWTDVSPPAGPNSTLDGLRL